MRQKPLQPARSTPRKQDTYTLYVVGRVRTFDFTFNNVLYVHMDSYQSPVMSIHYQTYDYRHAVEQVTLSHQHMGWYLRRDVHVGEA